MLSHLALWSSMLTSLQVPAGLVSEQQQVAVLSFLIHHLILHMDRGFILCLVEALLLPSKGHTGNLVACLDKVFRWDCCLISRGNGLVCAMKDGGWPGSISLIFIEALSLWPLGVLPSSSTLVITVMTPGFKLEPGS